METLQTARYRYIKEFPSGQFSGAEKSNKAYEELLEKYEKDYEPVMYTPETVQTQHAGSKGELMGAMEREIKGPSSTMTTPLLQHGAG